MNHSQFTFCARQSFKGPWLMASLITVLYCLICSAASSLVIGIILTGPLYYGYTVFIKDMIDKSTTEIETLFCGFNRFIETMIAGLIYSLAIAVGTMLLIVPGIILSLGLSMTFRIMADDPNISGIDALKKSWEMTTGYKTDLFVFHLRFIGWFLLAILTCGIGMYVLTPYFTTSLWFYYRELKNHKNIKFITN